MTAIGMNLTGLAYYSSEHPFLDRMKDSHWFAGTAAGWQNVPDGAPFSADGYPQTIPTDVPFYIAEFDVDPPSAGTSNVYVVTYTGKAQLALPFDTILSQKPGEIVFRHDGDSTWTGLQVLGVDAADPLTAIHVVRQDQQSLYAAGGMFNPAFLDKASHWGTLRFSGWDNINGGNLLTSWSERTTPDAATYATSNGAPIEVEVRLANEAHADMWLSIPAHAGDDYVRQTLAYVRDHLDPSLKVNVEYSNEVWNFGFEQASYALTMGDQLWGTDANHDGRIDSSDPAEHVADGWVRYYGYRSAQVAAIAQSVFGASAATRVIDVLATQTGNAGLEPSILAGVASAKLGSAAHLFDAYAVTTYFGYAFDGIGGDARSAADRATVLGWARSGAARIDAAFHELEFGGVLGGGGSLADLATTLAGEAQVAAANHLALVAYEGGVHLTAVGYDPAVQGEITAFFTALANDPRMGTLYTKMAAEFAAAGGTDLNNLADTGAGSVYGNWGVLDSIYDSHSPRYDALLAAAADPDIARVSTAASSYVMDITVNSLAYTGAGAFTGTGNIFADTITGGAHGNMLYGLAGDDRLVGGNGADLLDGGTGADRLSGGSGDDVYIVDDPADLVTEGADRGTDEVRTALAAFVLPANVENLTHPGATGFAGTGNALANLITGGSGVNALHGLDGDDILVGGAMGDLLDGGAGADRMVGGGGDDTYLVDDPGDTIVESAGGGRDEVRTTLAAWTLGSELETLSFTGTGNFAGTGNALDNVLTGGAGDDTLDGGAGMDRMIGGGGADLYIVDNDGDMVVEDVGGGADTIRTALASYTLPANVEALVSTGDAAHAFGGIGNASDNSITGSLHGANSLSGRDGDDVLVGGSGNDLLSGDAGADRMIGRAGDDVYLVDNAGDRVVEVVNGGTDTVYSTVGYTLPANVESLTLRGGDPIAGRGNALANMIFGNDAANLIQGGAGDDLLVAGGGADRVAGGGGSDRLFGQDGDDVANGGDGDDFVSGDAGNDVLFGGAGRDSLQGGAGADRFVFQPGDLAPAPDAMTSFLAFADRINDFSHADRDRIDLSRLDAKATVAGDDTFTFIGTHGFTDHAGELRIEDHYGTYDVTGDVDGDGRPDFHLAVTSATVLVASDFIL